MAGTLLQTISKDEIERARFLSRRKFINDLESNMIGAREEGRVEGRVENSVEIAREMMNRSMDIHIIAGITKLPIEKIQQLAKEVQQ